MSVVIIEDDDVCILRTSEGANLILQNDELDSRKEPDDVSTNSNRSNADCAPSDRAA